MLIKCPECDLQVSDKAAICPHCGYPLLPTVKPHAPRKANKRRRLPNGFGQISEIKNRNLRNPFRAMVSVGKDTNGRPICKPLRPEAYFPTYNDAYAALVEYNKNPYDLAPAITVKELYEKWSEEHFKKISDKSASAITLAWKYCAAVYDMRVMDTRGRHIKGCMEEGRAVIRGKEKTPNSKVKLHIKSLFNLMLDYALEYEIVERNYSRTFKLDEETIEKTKKVEKEHLSFTDEEIELLWDHVDIVYGVDIMLIQCYSGWRPQELGLIKLEDVDLSNWMFKGGMKTKAGADRIVPIHSRIRVLIERKYKEAETIGSIYLLNFRDKTLTYNRYATVFKQIQMELNLNSNHRPHDGRKHFITKCKEFGVDEYAIKYMVGHSILDITEKIYTDRKFEWLKKEIEKIR